MIVSASLTAPRAFRVTGDGFTTEPTTLPEAGSSQAGPHVHSCPVAEVSLGGSFQEQHARKQVAPSLPDEPLGKLG